LPETINVAVIGAGLMGHGIAQVFASAGHSVTLTASNSTLAEASSRIARNLKQLGHDVAPILSRIKLETALQVSVSQADLVIEAVPEKLEVKSAKLPMLLHKRPFLPATLQQFPSRT